MTKQAILDATQTPPDKGDFIWDGVDEDERPLTKQEMRSSIKPMGRPKSENPKLSTTIRLSADVLAYFRATGKGWQTRMDDALKEYVASHR